MCCSFGVLVDVLWCCWLEVSTATELAYSISRLSLLDHLFCDELDVQELILQSLDLKGVSRTSVGADSGEIAADVLGFDVSPTSCTRLTPSSFRMAVVWR